MVYFLKVFGYKVKGRPMLKLWMMLISLVLFSFLIEFVYIDHLQNFKQRSKMVVQYSSEFVENVAGDRRFPGSLAQPRTPSFLSNNTTPMLLSPTSSDGDVVVAKGAVHNFTNQIVHSIVSTTVSSPPSQFGQDSQTTEFLDHRSEGPTELPVISYVRKATVYFQGGLGNVMFQYASLLGIARENSMIPVIYTDSEMVKTFLPSILLSPLANVGENFSRKGENLPCAFDKTLFSITEHSDVQLRGYFQSWKYFNQMEDDLRKQFVFHEDIIKTATNELADIVQKHASHSDDNVTTMESGVIPINANTTKPPSNITLLDVNVTMIAVHVRLGDIVENQHLVKFGYVTAGREYLDEAMEYFRQTYSKPIFVVASNRLSWCKQNLKGGDIYFLKDNNRREVDLATLSLCNHTIVTVGSFGWWAAWLAGGETVYFKNFTRPGSTLDSQVVSEDYFFPDWIGI